MIAQCTGTPSAAQPHRDDWPWAQLQRGDASRFLIPPNGARWSWSFGTNLDSHTHWDASSGAHFALTRTTEASLWIHLADFENLSDFTKAGARTDRSVVNVAAGCASVCEAHSGAAGPAENAPQFQSHFHLLNPNKLSPTRQNDSPLGSDRSFFLRYVVWTLYLLIARTLRSTGKLNVWLLVVVQSGLIRLCRRFSAVLKFCCFFVVFFYSAILAWSKEVLHLFGEIKMIL